MAEPKTTAYQVDQLAEEFACRWRAGERPSVEEYVRKHTLAEFSHDICPECATRHFGGPAAP